jgi:SAM-dependent methyltransferase
MKRNSSCTVCGAEGEVVVAFDKSVTSESRLVDAPSELRVCSCCGHMFTTTAIDFDRYYADHYDAALTDGGPDEIVTDKSGQVRYRTDVDFELFQAMALHEIEANSRIFELGCGRGRILSRLAKHGYRDLWAYDLSESYRAGAERHCGADHVFIGDKPKNFQADLACSFFVLEHDTAPQSSLDYLASILEPGGLLYLQLPNYEANLGDLACADHVSHFSPTYLSRLLARSGFAIEAMDDTTALGAVSIFARRTTAAPAPAQDDPWMCARSAQAARGFAAYVDRLRSLSERLEGREVVLYGAGFYAALVRAHLEPKGFRITGLFDANPSKQGTVRQGSVVEPPEALERGNRREAELVVCVNAAVSRSIADRYAPYVAHAHIV